VSPFQLTLSSVAPFTCATATTGFPGAWPSHELRYAR
jgi:hypothetical protein